MSLTREEVLHLAKLARLGLSEAEVEMLRQQLSQILDYFAMLNEIDTSEVPPTMHAIPMQNVTREDVPRPSLQREAVLANAPQAEEGYIRVRAVLE
ncbi:MAG TPA: Asp-tRNA(Asn)/Glu-tRNA(Gln) amidotransferase subunit GatC [Dehalococcoidia bacterium]|nr:Asp-tRNA(Asn)/Glu-tRNA(Gln) amidotransferase subunit GatC [Dehalococcoidia bacterium]